MYKFVLHLTYETINRFSLNLAGNAMHVLSGHRDVVGLFKVEKSYFQMF